MRVGLIPISLAVFGALPAPALAEDPLSILQKLHEKQIERLEGVQTYMVDQSLLGNRVQMYFERVAVKDSAGAEHEVFRPIMDGTNGCGDAQSDENFIGAMSADQLDQVAGMYDMLGDGMATEIEDGLEQAGLPRGLLAATGSDPWATLDPRVMMGGQADFYRMLADGKRQREIEAAAPDDSIHDFAKFASVAQLVGTEPIDGRNAHHLKATGLDMSHEDEEQGMVFNVDEIDMWIDSTEYVPLRMKMTGTAVSGKESRPMTMEKLDLDYRAVPDSGMYESYRQVMRMAGVMDAAQQAQMREAQQQMVELEKQMAAMPAAQRDMMMRQMGPQLEMMRNMTSGDGFELVTTVHDIIVDHCDKEILVQTIAIAGAEFTVPTAAAMTAGAEEEVEARPYYIDEKGIGVLRYSQPSGPAGRYLLTINGLTDNPERPREVLVGAMGPYSGPDVAIYIGSINMLGVPADRIELVLFEEGSDRPAARFRPEVNPGRAEGMEQCGTVSSTGECSR